jgi:redox-sensing transcriptional repressor
MGSLRRIPVATVERLPVYLRVLTEADEETMSSDHLAARAGVNAAQVRKDLSHLGSYGTRGVGYDVAYLLRQINRVLGLSTDRRVAIVGIGNLGHALARYGGFGERGFRMVAAFDTDPATIGERIGGVEVYPMSLLREVIKGKKVDLVVLTTPAHAAQDAADAIVAAGVTSILNFAPIRVEAPHPVVVRQVDLGVELQILSYYEQHQHLGEQAAAANGVGPIVGPAAGPGFPTFLSGVD